MSRSGPRALAIVAVLLLAACGPTPPTATSPTPPVPTASADATATPAAQTPSPTLSVTPIATPAGDAQLDGLLRSFVSGWHSAGETLFVEQNRGVDGTVVLAVPLDGTPAVPVISYGGRAGVDVSPVGRIAVSLITAADTSRIAAWDPSTGRATWVGAEEAGVLRTSPVWSRDGRSIYYSAVRTPDDAGIFRLDVATGRSTRVRAPETIGATLEGLTPDGLGLSLTRGGAGGMPEVMDLRTGAARSFSLGGIVQSWRTERPRALVLTGFCCAGGPRGTLAVWDDISGEHRLIYGTELTPREAVATGAWSPDGTRLVATVHDTTTFESTLMTMNDTGTDRLTLAGTDGGVVVAWLRAGIAYTRSSADAATTELFLVAPSGGPSTPILTTGYTGRWWVVSQQ